MMFSREPKADPSTIVPDSGVRTSTVSCTHGVSHPSNSVLRSSGQSRRGALDIAVRGTLPGGPKGDESGVQGAKQGIKLEGSNEHLPVAWPRWGWRGTPRDACRSASALCMVPSTSPCSAPVAPVVGEVTEAASCCHSVQAEASGKCVRKAWRMHGHSALPNMLT